MKFNLLHPLSPQLTSCSNVVLLRDTWIQDTASNWPGHRDLLSGPLRRGHLSHLSISPLELSWLKKVQVKPSSELGRKHQDNLMHNYTTDPRKEHLENPSAISLLPFLLRCSILLCPERGRHGGWLLAYGSFPGRLDTSIPLV